MAVTLALLGRPADVHIRSNRSVIFSAISEEGATRYSASLHLLSVICDNYLVATNWAIITTDYGGS